MLTIFFTSNCILQSQFQYLLIADCHMFLHLLSKMKQMAALISEKHHLSYSDPTEALSVNMSWWENKRSILWVPQSRFQRLYKNFLSCVTYMTCVCLGVCLYMRQNRRYICTSLLYLCFIGLHPPLEGDSNTVERWNMLAVERTMIGLVI